MAVKPIPDGFHTITPYLTVSDANGLLDFITGAFGAREAHVMRGPDGAIAHADVIVGDSHVIRRPPWLREGSVRQPVVGRHACRGRLARRNGAADEGGRAPAGLTPGCTSRQRPARTRRARVCMFADTLQR
jgi:hypothetical protein